MNVIYDVAVLGTGHSNSLARAIPEGPYVLTPGTLEPRKNIDRMKAFT
jgi:hypothetical protein